MDLLYLMYVLHVQVYGFSIDSLFWSWLNRQTFDILETICKSKSSWEPSWQKQGCWNPLRHDSNYNFYYV